jgi:hypothetical protein
MHIPDGVLTSVVILHALIGQDAKVRFLNCNAIVHVTNLLGNERIDFVVR